MPDPEQITLSFVGGGMNGALNPANVPDNQYSRAVNVELINQRPHTRRGVRVLPFIETDDATVKGFQSGNFQGATFFNPAKGQSQISFAEDGSRIMCSIAGKRYQVIPREAHPRLSNVVIERVDGVQDGNPNLHLVWWYQAENYIIAQDGEADTWIWDGFTTPFESTGLNTVDKPKSKLANGATVGAYVHGRIVQVVNSRQVIVGDIIHKSNQTDSINILDTTEQVYWATGSYFSPPSSMGNIIAAELLPLRDTQHGHGDLMLHCEDGIFSLNLNLYPRTSWENTPLVKHVLLETGARGPYALALYDGDQFFRSRHGLQSLRSARGESQLLGNPYNPISEEVDTWLKNDYEPFVRFTSISKWAIERRLYITVDPWINGAVRGSRGIVSLNFAPVATAQTNRAWEGLHTYPPEIANPIQMVNGVFNGRDRVYMFARGDDGKNRIAEFSQDLRNDILIDGTERRISCQIVTKAMVGAGLFSKAVITQGILYMTDVSGVLDWGVWARNTDCQNWTYWRQGQVCVKSDDCCPEDEAGCNLNDYCPQEFELNLGEMPDSLRHNRKIQLLIRWRGSAAVEGVKIRVSPGDPDEGTMPEGAGKCPKNCVAERMDCIYDDYENVSDENRWEVLNG